MKKDFGFLFRYGSNKCICTTATSAIDFINSIKGLKVNEYCKNKVLSVFNGQKVFTIATAGCGMRRIQVFKALAPTLEEHHAVLNERVIQEEETMFNEAMNALYNIKNGEYQCRLYFSYQSALNFYISYEFKDFRVKADSPADAYRKGYDLIQDLHGDKLLLCIAEMESHEFEYDILA